MLRLLRLDGIEVGCWEWFREGGGGGGGVGGEGLRELDGALYAGREEGDSGRSWCRNGWSYLKQVTSHLTVSDVEILTFRESLERNGLSRLSWRSLLSRKSARWGLLEEAVARDDSASLCCSVREDLSWRDWIMST